MLLLVERRVFLLCLQPDPAVSSSRICLGIPLSWVVASPSVPLLSVGQGTLDAVPRGGIQRQLLKHGSICD